LNNYDETIYFEPDKHCKPNSGVRCNTAKQQLDRQSLTQLALAMS